MSDDDRRDYRSLGEILSDAREQRDWTVEEVSDRTKITPRQIHALEADDLASLSGPVYTRGFLRSLCELYDLDREWLMMKLDSQMESVGDSTELPELPVAPPKVAQEPTESPTSEESPAPESTWTVETVETARVYRMRPASRKLPPRWVWLLLLLVVAALVVWGVAFRGRSTGSTGMVESPSMSAPVVADDGGVVSPSAAGAPTQDLAAANSGEDGSDVVPVVLPKEETQTATDEVVEDGKAPEDDEPPAVVSSANVDQGDQTRVRYVDSPGEGIKSVLRQSAEDKQEFSLKLIATGLVTARVAFDDQPHQSRRMKDGDEWLLKAIDHFSVEFSDVSKVVIEVDGVRREAPRGLRGEWWLYRTATPTDSN